MVGRTSPASSGSSPPPGVTPTEVTSTEVGLTKIVESNVYKPFDHLVENVCSEGAVLVASTAFKAAGIKPSIEEYYSEEKLFTVHVYRFICGIEGNHKHYAELGFVFTDFLDETRLLDMVTTLAEWKFFKYHPEHESLYSRTIYIFAKKYKCKEKLLKAVGDRKRKFFFIPVLGKMRHLIPWVYFADFIKNRLDGFINALMPGWKRSGKNHDVYRKYKALLSGELQKRGVQSLYSSMLYYINIIEQRIEELEKRFSEDVVRSVKILFEIFRKILKFIDEFLKKPLKLSMLKKALLVLRRTFGASYQLAAELAYKYSHAFGSLVVNFAGSFDFTDPSAQVHGYLDLLSRATPVKR
jgi:hypothetical protein